MARMNLNSGVVKTMKRASYCIEDCCFFLFPFSQTSSFSHELALLRVVLMIAANSSQDADN